MHKKLVIHRMDHASHGKGYFFVIIILLKLRVANNSSKPRKGASDWLLRKTVSVLALAANNARLTTF